MGLIFPFGAGRYDAFSCTNLLVNNIGNYGGGVQVGIIASQRAFCGAKYRTVFKIRPRTSSNTGYVFNSEGNFIRVTGTEGGLVSRKSGETIFALSSGSGTVHNCKGQTANIVGGQQAIASPKGIRVEATASPAFQVVGGRIVTHPDNTVLINGVETRWLPPGEATVEVTAISGETIIKTLRQSQRGQWR